MCNPRFSFIRWDKLRLWTEAMWRVPRGRRSAVRAGHLVFATIRAIRLFRFAKESRESDGGFLKGGTVGDSLKWRSFGTFLPPRAEKYIFNPPINCNLPSSSCPSKHCSLKIPHKSATIGKARRTTRSPAPHDSSASPQTDSAPETSLTRSLGRHFTIQAVPSGGLPARHINITIAFA